MIWSSVAGATVDMLEGIQKELYDKAVRERDELLVQVNALETGHILGMCPTIIPYPVFPFLISIFSLSTCIIMDEHADVACIIMDVATGLFCQPESVAHPVLRPSKH